MDIFRKNLLFIRESQQLTQEAFADLFNLPRSRYQTYEKKKAWISIENANKICNAYGYTLDEFFNQDLSKIEKKGFANVVMEDTGTYLSAKDIEILELKAERAILMKSIDHLNDALDDLKKDNKSLKEMAANFGPLGKSRKA